MSVSEIMGPDWRFLGDYSSDPSMTWQCFSGRSGQDAGDLERRLKLPLLAAVNAAVRAAKSNEAGVLVSHLPGVTLRANLLRQRIAADVPHIAFAFNFTDLPRGWWRKLYRHGLKSVDEFVVFSEFEKRLYSHEFGIPETRFRFLHWAMDVPEVDAAVGLPFSRPYLVAIGGEGRDYRNLLRAVSERPDIRLVLIARPSSVEGLSIPNNVRLFLNLPAEKVWAIARGSAGMVLPLRGDRTPNGHVTIVGAQLLGVPMIITDSAGVCDYVDLQTALLVGAGDAAQIGQAMEALLDDPERGAQLAAVARSRALIRSDPARWVEYFREVTDRGVVGPQAAALGN